MRGSAAWRTIRFGEFAAAGEGALAGLAPAPLGFGAPAAFGAPTAFGALAAFGAPAAPAAGSAPDGAGKGGGITASATGWSAARAIAGPLNASGRIDSSKAIGKSPGYLAMRDVPQLPARARPVQGAVHYSHHNPKLSLADRFGLASGPAQ